MPQQIDAPVTRVTVMEDRAQVRRQATVQLQPGRHVLEVERVTPLVVDRSLRGGLDGGGTRARLLDLGVERSSTVAATRPWLQRELEAQAHKMERERSAAAHAVELARADTRRLRQVRGFLLQHICGEAGRGIERRDSWEQELHRLEEQLERATGREEKAQDALEELEERAARLGDRLQAAMQPSVHYWGTLRAVVDVKEAGSHVMFWEYLVPCALWRPTHQAELIKEGRLRWTVLGTVWQNTGEDWSGVALRLSTERPTLGAELPLLEEDLLRIRAKTDEEKRTIEVSARDEAIEEISPGLDAEARVGVVPGVDDGGEVRVFELERQVTIPTDGRAHLVTLDSFECAAKIDRVSYPELAEAVMLRSQQKNAGARPLLAGPVRLIRGGGFVGRTQVGFVAPGEAFALGWGSQDEIQVSRRSGQSSEERTLSRKVCHTIWTKVYVSNTGGEPRRVTLTERIPVSEVEEVEVRLMTKDTTPGFRQTSDGHLIWDLDLEAGARQEVLLTYQVDAHRKVVWR